MLLLLYKLRVVIGHLLHNRGYGYEIYGVYYYSWGLMCRVVGLMQIVIGS
jgi:hypothetical protein